MSEKEWLVPSVVEARDLSEAWWKCLRETLQKGHIYTIDRGSGKSRGQRRMELDFLFLTVRFPGDAPIVPDVPQGVPAPASTEAVERYMRYLMTSEKADGENYTYGEDLEEPIFRAIKMFKEEGFGTNQACLSVGGASSILLEDPQCLRVVDLRVRYGKLAMFVYFRSWDLYGGFPMNLGGLQLLKAFIAEEVGVEDGQLIAASKGLHLYESAWEAACLAARLSPEEVLKDYR